MIRLDSIIRGVILIIGLVYCFYGGTQIWEALSSNKLILSSTTELTTLRDRYDQRMKKLSYVRSDRYVEDVARQDFGWTKEQETIYQVNELALPEASAHR